MSDELKDKVVEAALRLGDNWLAGVWQIPELISLGEAVRAYRKSLEPRERYAVQRDNIGEWSLWDNGHGQPLLVARIHGRAEAERIAQLLNQGGSER